MADVGGNALAPILDLELNPLARAREANPDRLAFRCRLDGVLDEVPADREEIRATAA